jgi:hypothetical protein
MLTVGSSEFSSYTDRLAQLSHITFLNVTVVLAPFSMDLVLPKIVASTLSSFPVCCGVPGAVNATMYFKINFQKDLF